MRYAYPCEIVRDEEEARATGREAYLATFPGVHGAHTGGWSLEGVRDRLQDCLETALDLYVRDGQDIPEPRDPSPGQILASVSPAAAATFALYTAMREQGVSIAELARQLGIRESRVRRLIDRQRSSRPADMERALAALGRHLVVEDQPSDSIYSSVDA